MFASKQRAAKAAKDTVAAVRKALAPPAVPQAPLVQGTPDAALRVPPGDYVFTERAEVVKFLGRLLVEGA